MEDRQTRLFLALILSMGIWMGVNYFFFPNTSTKKNTETKQTQSDKTSENTKQQITSGKTKESNSADPVVQKEK